MKTTTPALKCAKIGSISHGTLRDEDLLEVFTNELEWQIQRNEDYFSHPENLAQRDRLNAILGEAQDCWTDDGEDIRADKWEETAELINDTLINALEVFCLPYFYFGAHPGDGSDFGFWPIDIDDIKEHVEFSSTTEQEYPNDDFQGEWLHVNERGNCTLYVRENGQDKEIWAIV